MTTGTNKAKEVLKAYERDHSVKLELDPKPVDPDQVHTQVTASWNFLASAKLSVENALAAASRQRSVRLAHEGKSPKGRYSEADQDLLRAALVFAGAGLDSTLKRLLEDCLAEMTRMSSIARDEFNSFVRRAISRDLASDDPILLAEALLADRPRTVLERQYLESLTGGSLQSSDSVRRVAKALGVDEPSFFKRIDPDKSLRALNQMFVARNEMIHELDLRDPMKATRGALGHRRVTREVGKTRTWAVEALSVAQFVVNDVNSRLTAG